MKPARYGPTIVRVGVSALLLFVVFRAIHPDQLMHDLGRLEGSRLAIIMFLAWCGQLLCVQRWRLFAASSGIVGGYRRFFQMYFAGMFFNVGLPSLVGGDVIKAYLVSRMSGKPLWRGLASVLQDRAAGLISLLACGSVAAGWCALAWRGIPLWSLYLLTWVGVGGALWLAWKGERIYGRLLKPQARTPAQRAIHFIADFHQALVGMRMSVRGIAQVVACSFVNSALSLWLLQQVGAAAGYPLPFVCFSALLPLITLATLLPITLGGLGIREWAYVEGLGLLNVPPQAALLVGLTTSALLVVSDLVGMVFLPTIPAGLKAELRNPSASG